MGGEFTASVTYVVETSPPGPRGLAGSLTNVGSVSGSLLASALAAACAPAACPRTIRGRPREVLRQLDPITAIHIFSMLYNRYVDSHRFPELNARFARLGLNAVGGQIRLE